ncbi:MAG: AAA family ATPase [Sphingobium sp.]
MVTLEDLGPRICILGRSGSGKSTLAEAVARKKNLRPIHLDQLRHLPNTDWQVRSDAEFVALHDEALAGDAWVMDGNYSLCLRQRLGRATGVIKLDASTTTSLVRYLRRCWFERSRIGGLAGGKDSVKWDMIHHIVVTTRRNRRRNEAQFAAIELPKIKLSTSRDLAEFYRREGIGR